MQKFHRAHSLQGKVNPEKQLSIDIGGFHLVQFAVRLCKEENVAFDVTGL